MLRAILTSLLPVLAAAADFTVGSATAASGQKATGSIAVPAGVGTAASISVIVVNGARPGPVLALVAGSHGTEYASILALQKLAQAAGICCKMGERSQGDECLVKLELSSDTENCVDELSLSNRIALGYPTDLPFTDCTPPSHRSHPYARTGSDAASRVEFVDSKQAHSVGPSARW